MAKWLKRIFSQMKTKLKELLEANSIVVENELKKYIQLNDSYGLYDVMAYSLLMGGKRIRPFLVIETYKAFSGKNDIEKALPFACALEMIHTYSLIHDDLPSMDNDDYRRGKLTSHKVYGEAKALLAGDTLLTYAFEVLASNKFVSDKSIKLATLTLSRCAGGFGMAGGQMLDLNSGDNIKSLKELKEMHSLKTGALIRCAVLLGYLAYTDVPDSSVMEKLENFATNIGIAFQFRDDILDVISNKETLGKLTGSDDKNGKTTTLTFLSLNEAQKQVNDLTVDAIRSIDACLGENGIILKELAKYMVEREK